MIIAGLFIELADEEVFFTEGDFQLFGSREKKKSSINLFYSIHPSTPFWWKENDLALVKNVHKAPFSLYYPFIFSH